MPSEIVVDRRKEPVTESFRLSSRIDEPDQLEGASCWI
jgi:hypothetical protein